VNLSVALVKEGFASVHRTGEKSQYATLLKEAEDSAKQQRLRMWKNNEEEKEEQQPEEEKPVSICCARNGQDQATMRVVGAMFEININQFVLLVM
jgi:hypothetical protein